MQIRARLRMVYLMSNAYGDRTFSPTTCKSHIKSNETDSRRMCSLYRILRPLRWPFFFHLLSFFRIQNCKIPYSRSVISGSEGILPLCVCWWSLVFRLRWVQDCGSMLPKRRNQAFNHGVLLWRRQENFMLLPCFSKGSLGHYDKCRQTGPGEDIP